jgi:hypothetical protein
MEEKIIILYTFIKDKSQAPPAKPEACELEPLKAAIVFC